MGSAMGEEQKVKSRRRRAERGDISKEAPAMSKDTTDESITRPHKAARPLKYIKDKEGNGWLCDKDVDPDGDLRAQDCWRCDEMAFPFGGR